MDAKEEVRTKLAIEDVVGEYVQLKRAGRNFKGLSPFTPERTPSFVVSPDKGIWHDFSSGRGGDVFAFVMEMEGLDFRQALDNLARRAGVDLTKYQDNSKGKREYIQSKDRIYEINDLAAKFYQAQLKGSKDALSYVRTKRGFTNDTIVAWRLGYSPNNGTALLDFMKKKGYSEKDIQLAGLTSKAYRGGLQDMFRGRLQIPLCDASGRVIGFTARQLDDDPNAPKYINTPSTPLYDKSSHVYGLHFAKEAIRKGGHVVLAEGNLDVITSHQAKVNQVVATAGTALTTQHIKTLSRLTGDVRLCFDADKAGIAATERAIPIAHGAGINLQVITLPSGKDPDELIRLDVKLWQEAIEKPQYAVDWLIDRYLTTTDIGTAMGKRTFTDVVLAVIRQLNDSVEQDHYLAKLAEILSVNKEALRVKLTGEDSVVQPTRRGAKKPDNYGTTVSDKERIEEHLMALTLMVPSTRKALYDLAPEMFDDDRAKQVFELLQREPEFDGTDHAGVQNFAEYGKILTLVYETLYQDLEPLEQSLEATRLRAKLVSIFVKNQKQSLIAALHDAEPKQADELLRKVKDLDALLKTNQQP